MSYRVYLIIYVALALWYAAAGLHLIAPFIWLPIGLIMVLDFIFTRDSGWRYILAAMLMIPVIIFGCIQIFTQSADYQRWIYRVYETIPFLIALALYQFLIYRFVGKRR